MFNNLPTLATRRPVSFLMIAVAVLCMGWVSARHTPKQFMIDVDFPTLRVWIPYPGATPEQVEQTVTIPAEGLLRTVPKLYQINSHSHANGVWIRLEYDVDADMSQALTHVRDRVERLKLQLPRQVEDVFISRSGTDLFPIMSFAIFREEGIEELSNWARNWLKPQLMRIPDVADVEVRGTGEPRIVAAFDQDALRANGLSISEALADLRRSVVGLTAGSVDDGETVHEIRVAGEIRTVEEVANLPLANGRLRLHEVARIDEAPEWSGTHHSLDGRQGIFVRVAKVPGANTLETGAAINAEIERAQDEAVLDGATIFIFFDQAADMEEAMGLLMKTGQLGALLAFLVLFMFLRDLRPVLIVGTAVPLSLTVGLAYLYFSGSSFNAITMAAFVIAIGLLVDNAIVVMENIMRFRQMGYSPLESAQKGATEVSVAISTATLTTLVVFIPAIYVEEGELAMYMRTFSWPMCIALTASLFVSLTIIPLLASQALRWKGWTRRIGFRRRSAAQFSAPEAASHFAAPRIRRGWLTRAYAASLAWVLHHRLATSLMLIVLGGVTLAVTSGQVGMRMLPPVDNRIVEVRVNLDPQYDWDRVQLTMDTVGAILDLNREELGISNVYVSPNGRGGEVRAFLYTIEEARARGKTLLPTYQVEELLREQLPSLLPGGEVRLSSAPSVQFSQRSFGLRMRGDDLQSLLKFADQFAKLMEEQPEVMKARVEIGNPNEEIHLDVDEVMADSAGMSPADVAMTINAALSGTRLFNIPRDHGDMPVFAQLKSEDRATLNDLEEITIAGAGGYPVPLRRLVTKARAEGPNDILREDGKNVVSITAETTTENMSEFKEDVTQLAASFRLPRGYTIDFGEKLSELERTLQNFNVMLILAVILIYLVMGAIFESFMLPFSILISVPLSFIGVAWTLYLSNSMMDVIALIGTILMCGLVVNNGIVLIDHINQLRKAGLPRNEAIVRGGINRLRPIGMTALTTILGCIPLAMGSKFQDLAFESLGRTMIGGLTVGTLITLLATPLLYTLLEDAQRWCTRFVSGILLLGRK